MFFFLHQTLPAPLLLQIGIIKIYWYGFFMSLAVICGFFLTRYLLSKYQLLKASFYDLCFYLVLGGIIGGRLYYVLYDFNSFKNNWTEIFKIWHGGLGIFGVLAGGGLVLYIYSQMNKVSLWQLLDIFAPALAFGQALGRWGNYFNQELFGLPTSLPWGIPISLENRPAAFLQATYFHPTFLYESLVNVCNFFLLLWLHKQVLNKKINPPFGRIFFIYLFIYCFFRFFIEFLRIDYAPYLWGFRPGQIICFVLLLVSSAVLVSQFLTAGRVVRNSK